VATRLIAPPLTETPASLASVAGRRRLPPELLAQVSRRLQVMTLTAAVLWVVGPVLRHLALHAAAPGDPRWSELLPVDLVAAASAVTSLALYRYLRSVQPEPARVSDLGLAYMVASAFSVGVLMHWGPAPEPTSVAPTITWTGPILLMSGVLVPAPLLRLLGAGLLAASMDPLGMAIGRAAGHYPAGTPADLLLMHYPNYLLLGVALVLSHAVTRLGQQVTRERELGSYRLGELLGRGGMGDVYRATHRMLARPAAIKLIRPEVLAAGDGAAAPLMTARFRREAEAAARLRSPHTVELYDFGVAEDGTLYCVMELLDGMTLEALVRQYGPQPASRVVHILRQACESLEEAHACGLVHRDIKPANLHLGRLGLRHDVVKVLDFGLVKSVAGGNPEHSLATEVGLTPGTPAYMAPELAGEEPVDGRADLYALGCVAYWLLTGRLVFDGGSALQMIARHLREAPLPPSLVAGHPVPAGLEALVLACLAKESGDRPAGAGELGRALAALEIEPWTEQAAVAWWHGHAAGALTALMSDHNVPQPAGHP
jgi:hypothetical protein